MFKGLTRTFQTQFIALFYYLHITNAIEKQYINNGIIITTYWFQHSKPEHTDLNGTYCSSKYVYLGQLLKFILFSEINGLTSEQIYITV